MGPPHRGYHGRMPKGDDRDIEQRPVHPNIHQSILEATKGKNYVTPVMRDHSEESGEPHIYGTRGGRSMLLLYNAENEPQWETVEVTQVESVKIWLDEHFEKREIPAEFDPTRARTSREDRH